MQPRDFSAVTVPNETKALIDHIAVSTDRSRSRVVRDAIAAYAKTAAIKKALDANPQPTLEVRG
jgi:predicted transcriptional regulator